MVGLIGICFTPSEVANIKIVHHDVCWGGVGDRWVGGGMTDNRRTVGKRTHKKFKHLP
jgi:hypothetical protein